MSNIIINKNAVIILNPFLKLSHSQIYVQDLKKKNYLMPYPNILELKL